MKLAICPLCRVVHEAVGCQVLEGADEERVYQLTHCRLCSIPSAQFHTLPDGPELSEEELGFPAAVVPWMDGDTHVEALAHPNLSASQRGAQSRARKTPMEKDVTSEPFNKKVPDDFPRNRQPASVSGYQQKLALRKVDGQFVEGWTDKELYARFDACADLVDQLTAYCQRKLTEPDMSVAALLPKVRRGAEGKGWDLTGEELDWIMARVASSMSKNGGDDHA